jgi:hypothetical protein
LMPIFLCSFLSAFLYSSISPSSISFISFFILVNLFILYDSQLATVNNPLKENSFDQERPVIMVDDRNNGL